MMSIEDGTDLAGMGGLMGIGMAAPDFSGAIIDGAVSEEDRLSCLRQGHRTIYPGSLVFQVEQSRRTR